MSGLSNLLASLERLSDWISPIVVKEVRQVARGREFFYSFAASLIAALGIAFLGSADALSGSGMSGRWAFGALTSCLGLVALFIIPLGAFNALRTERLEQTLELITLTALTPRRVIVGKLLTQGVKLSMLFAALAPFIAMCFLLGGVDVATIGVSLFAVFVWSLWASSAGLFLSSLLESRAMAGLAFGGAIIGFVFMFTIGRTLYMVASTGARVAMFGGSLGTDPWWPLAIMTTACLATMVNFVLLAENRLSLPTEASVAPLRAGFLGQFLLLIGWTLSFIRSGPPTSTGAVEALGVMGGLHLTLVAMFAVSDDLVVPRPVLLRARRTLASPLRAIFRPGGAYGAIYVLAQMALLLAVAATFQPGGPALRWFAAICGYVCLFTGVPTAIYRSIRPRSAASLKFRVAVLTLLPFAAAMTLPDLLYYVLWQPDVLDLNFSARHLFNPLRTLANWNSVEANEWTAVPLFLGLTGVLAYGLVIYVGKTVREEVEPADPRPAAAAEEPGSANVY
jgi:hypothetical protein